MAAIMWARYDYFLQGSGLDVSFSTLPFVLSKIGPTLFFNFLIWFVGATYSFLIHERVPGLKETHDRWVDLDAQLSEMQKSLNGEKRRLENKFKSEKQALEGRLAECQGQITNLKASKEQLDKLDENYKTQITALGASLLHKYAEVLAASIVEIERDPSAMNFISPRRGKLTLLEFGASSFTIPIQGAAS